MGFFKTLLTWIVVFISCLVVYWILGWIYQDLIKESFAKLLLLLFMPLGFCLLVSGTDHPVWVVIRIIGLLLLVVPALVFHIKCMPEASKDMPAIYCMFLPMSCISALAGYLGVGYETLAYVSKASIFICFLVSLVICFFCNYATTGLFIFTLIVSAIALIVLGVKRIKEGSAFEY